VGSKLKGRVVSLADYGAFVEIEEGIEGLVHVSEMSWTRKVRHPSKIVKVGDEIEAMVMNIDTGNKRISLGLKQVEPNPWDVIGERYPVGTTIEGRIKNITDFGIFIGIDEGIDGLVHISDISWTKRIKHPSELSRRGRRFRRSSQHRQGKRAIFSGHQTAHDGSVDEVPSKYKPGTRVTGTVTNVTDFGVFVSWRKASRGSSTFQSSSKDKSGNPLSPLQRG